MNYIYNLGGYFSSRANEFSNKIALSYPNGDNYTYQEWEEQSNKLANWLLDKGFKQGDVIAIFNEKSFQSLSLMIAALKVGVIYTNLDTSSPKERIRKIVDRCNPKLVFCDSKELQTKFEGIQPDLTLNEDIIIQSHQFPGVLPEQHKEVHADCPAYIMFTSGSTGFPKGAVMSHQNILNFTKWSVSNFELSANDIFTNVNPIYFDNSVFDFYTSWGVGGTLVPLSSSDTREPQKLVQIIENTKCTVWFSVPSMLVFLLTTKAIGDSNFKNIRKVIFGGEGFPKPKLKKLYEILSDRATLYNVYGPTECTCICSSYIITEVDFENMLELAPLGKIAYNFGYYIDPIDDSDIKGELCLTGPNVGWGYFNDFERTSGAFVQSRNSEGISQRAYKTGDLVELREDGMLYILGRKDFQIKHMGYRIELEEIEAAMNTIPGVKESAAIYKKNEKGLGKIFGFIASNDLDDPTEILSKLKDLLPIYMNPSKITILKDLPKNQNGKIDRLNLTEL